MAAPRRPARRSPPPSPARRPCCSRAGAGVPTSNSSSSRNSTSSWRCRRPSPTRCRVAPCSNWPSWIRQMSARTVFTAGQMRRRLWRLLSALLGGLRLRAARRRSCCSMSRSASSISAISSSRASWSRSAAAAPPTSTRRSRSKRARCARTNCRSSRCWCRCSAKPRCCRELAAGVAQARLSARQARHQDRARGGR